MHWLRLLVVPCLAAAAGAMAWAARRGAWGARGGALAWAATVAVSVAAARWPDPNRFRHWAALVRDAPLAAQGLAGLALALAPGVVVAESWLAAARPRSAHALLALGCVAWALVYPALPMHLSAPDFDDFFVVAKFVGGTLPDWLNDKPLFTVWDHAYRALEPLAGADVLERFRVNGWYALVYVAALGLWVERCLAGLPPSPARRALPWLAALHLGPVVLSHTVAYELPCAAWIMATGLLLERLREAPAARPLAVIAALAVARTLQAGGHNATAIAWLPVYAHGALVLRARRAGAAELAWAAALGVSALLDAAGREGAVVLWAARSFDAARFERVLVRGWVPVAVLVAAAAALLRVREGRGAVARWLAGGWRAPDATHAAGAYLAVGAAIYLSANQDNLGLPQPGVYALDERIPWDFGTNHARYALFFYPALAALLGAAALRAGPVALAALLLFPPWWNVAYVTRFYRPPAGAPLPAQGYHRNTRYLALARARLRGVPAVWYLPLPRDHADHYLARVAAPGIRVRSLCDPDAPLHPVAPVLLTSYTMAVLARERCPDGLAGGARGDLSLSARDAIPAGALQRWCERPSVRARVASLED